MSLALYATSVPLALACFGFTALAELYLVLTVNPALLWIGALGLVGGYCYTGEPVVYKRFGLGAALSFALPGPLMNYGSWLGVGGAPSWPLVDSERKYLQYAADHWALAQNSAAVLMHSRPPFTVHRTPTSTPSRPPSGFPGAP